jgi:predicted Fe-S protein YdhL (DUF1289 family)
MKTTPCINICKVKKGICQGCFRTTKEISEWIDYSEEEKQEIYEKIEERKQK